MIHVCKKEAMSLEQVFFFVFAFLCCWLYHYELSKPKFFVLEVKRLMKILRFIFNADQEKRIVEFCKRLFFNAGILRV